MSSLCHKTILTISHDPVLQRTRSLILEVAGYTVFGTSNQAETLALMTGTAIDLVVMCPSVPEVARELLAAAVKKEHPSVPILVLGAGWEARCPGADGFINVWEGGAGHVGEHGRGDERLSLRKAPASTGLFRSRLGAHAG